jgi:hypothetical protein
MPVEMKAPAILETELAINQKASLIGTIGTKVSGRISRHRFNRKGLKTCIQFSYKSKKDRGPCRLQIHPARSPTSIYKWCDVFIASEWRKKLEDEDYTCLHARKLPLPDSQN